MKYFDLNCLPVENVVDLFANVGPQTEKFAINSMKSGF